MERSLLDVLVETIARQVAEAVAREVRSRLEGGQVPPVAQTAPARQQPSSAESLTTSQAAAFLGVSKRTLEGWREVPGSGPDFMKYGDSPRARVMYKRSALTEFQRRRPGNPV